jgi:hypothetical protein
MTRPTLSPAPFNIPPAPRSRDRAALALMPRTVSAELSWHADLGTKHVRGTDDTPRDVCAMFGVEQ